MTAAISPTANSSAFLLLPQGKPNPLEPRGFEGPDLRSRVTQNGSPKKSYYPPIYAAFNFLRNRYKAPNTGKLPERKFEQLVSSIYKQLRTFKDGVPSGELIKKIEAIAAPLFEHHKTTPEKLFEEFKDKYPTVSRLHCSSLEWDKLETNRKYHLLMTFVHQLSAAGYNIGISSWKPKDPIESLIRELNCRGPLMVMGNFGPRIYCKQPTILKSIAKRDIYGWPLPAQKWQNFSHLLNPILIIGAEKNRQGQFVYYIDPTEESDPSDPKKQKIYAMRYETLIAPNSICDLGSFLCSQNNRHLTESTGYAYHSAPASKTAVDEPAECKLTGVEQPKSTTVEETLDLSSQNNGHLSESTECAHESLPAPKAAAEVDFKNNGSEQPQSASVEDLLDPSWELCELDDKEAAQEEKILPNPLGQSISDLSGWEELGVASFEEEKSATVST